MCNPTPATDGSKSPELVMAVPDQIPPLGLPASVCVPASTHTSKSAPALTMGKALTVTLITSVVKQFPAPKL